jgi:hypothetical protein
VVMMNVRFDEVVRKDESKGGKRNERYGCWNEKWKRIKDEGMDCKKDIKIIREKRINKEWYRKRNGCIKEIKNGSYGEK